MSLHCGTIDITVAVIFVSIIINIGDLDVISIVAVIIFIVMSGIESPVDSYIIMLV
jgi:hypothetical protein